MTGTNVRMQIRYTQSAGEMQEEGVSTVSGKFSKSGNDVFLRYKETVEGVYGTVLNRICVKDGCVEMRRSGGIQSEMRFLAQEQTPFVHRSEVGELSFEVLTRELAFSEEEGGFSLRLCYALFAGGAPVSENTVQIDGTWAE